MEGVEILSINKRAITSGFGWESAIIAGVIFGAIIAMAIYHDTYHNTFAAIIGGIIVGIVISALVGCVASPVVGYTPVYKVTIEDTVNFNEFTEKYDIIKQDGKIYTIKER